MLCIRCNLKIPENSKFCPDCGIKQTEEKIAINKDFMTSINTRFTRKLIGYYLIWFFLHLGILLIFAKNIFPFGEDAHRSADFWPFGSDGLSEYDIREFLVYTICPLAYVMISLIFHQKKD